MMSSPFSQSFLRRSIFAFFLSAATLGTIALSIPSRIVEAQTTAPGQALTLRSDVQEANAKTGVVTARGNVQINYPSREIQATAAQALYYSRERRIELLGNVYILQKGNSLRGERVVYLIDEGRFVALPQTNRQVESIYLVPEATPSPSPAAATIPPLSPQLDVNP
jgi:lipopolysaccharide export system protein LptA